MTDREYEKMMVEAVNGGVDISHVMCVLNNKIAVAEKWWSRFMRRAAN